MGSIGVRGRYRTVRTIRAYLVARHCALQQVREIFCYAHFVVLVHTCIIKLTEIRSQRCINNKKINRYKCRF